MLLNKKTLELREPTRENIVEEMEKELRKQNEKKKSIDYVRSGWFDVIIKEEGFDQYIQRWNKIDFHALLLEYVFYYTGSIDKSKLISFLEENKSVGENND